MERRCERAEILLKKPRPVKFRDCRTLVLEETSDSHVVSYTRGRAVYLQDRKYGMINVERSFVACDTRVLSYILRGPHDISNSARGNTAILCRWHLRLACPVYALLPVDRVTDDQSTYLEHGQDNEIVSLLIFVLPSQPSFPNSARSNHADPTRS